MSKTRRNNGNKAVTAVLYILIVLLAIGLAAGAISALTKKDGFYVEYEDKKYFSADGKFSLPNAKKHTFTVVSGCSVKVRVNPESALKYKAYGTEYPLFTGNEQSDDFTGYFNITAEGDTVTLSFPQKASTEEAIGYKYGAEDIEIIYDDGTDEFELVFLSKDGEIAFTFGLTSEYLLLTLNVTAITF